MATRRKALAPIATVRVAAQTSLPTAGLDTKTQIVVDMAKAWPMIESLMGGTQAMRDDAAMLLREPRETRGEFDYRRQVATLYPALERTVSVMAGKPFSKQATFSEEQNKQITKLLENIDNQGRSGHAFLSDLFLGEVMPYGLCGVLVDQKKLVTAEGVKPTLADVKQQGVRPYWVTVKHSDIIGWREENVGGEVRLKQLRLRETMEEDDGNYNVKQVEAVRLLEPGTWQLFKKDAQGHLQLHDEGVTGLSYIPFQPFYGKRLGFMRGAPPLLNLAFLNVKHYQQQSDQDDSARFARKRLLVFSGVDDTQMIAIEASSSAAICIPVDAKAEVVQGSAESVEVGRGELGVLEEQMVRTGAELVVKMPSGARTATQDNNEAEGNKSELQRIVESFEDSVDNVLQFTADFLAAGEGAGGHITLFKDFGAATLTEASAKLVLDLHNAGLITKVTAIKEQQRRGMLSADIVPQDELDAVEEEGPPLGQVGIDPFTGLPAKPGAPFGQDPNDPAANDPKNKRKPPPPKAA